MHHRYLAWQSDDSWDIVDMADRRDLEKDLLFAGLLLYENKLKDESISVIDDLRGANIDTIMITGDNVYTAIHVARQCGILDENASVFVGDIGKDGIHFLDVRKGTERLLEDIKRDMEETRNPYSLALTGAALTELFSSKDIEVNFLRWNVLLIHIVKVLKYVKIFARTSPDQKTQLVEHFMQLGKIVGMCGDGTNDCGALKSSHVGLALSETEASIVAPFSSKNKDIKDVTRLIMEGRCSLQTSFTAFKYMMLYPIIQLASAIRLYQVSSILGDFQYLFQDVVLVLPLAVFMCYTLPWTKLSQRRPNSSLFNPRILISICTQIIFAIVGIILVNLILEDRCVFELKAINSLFTFSIII
jgi:cation-transporting ATPase 13A2